MVLHEIEKVSYGIDTLEKKLSKDMNFFWQRSRKEKAKKILLSTHHTRLHFPNLNKQLSQKKIDKS